MLFQSLSVWLSLCYPSSLNLFRNSKQADVYFLSLWPLQTFQYSGVLLDWVVISLTRAPRLMGEPCSTDRQRTQGGYSECVEKASEGLKKPVVVEKSPQLGQFWPQQQELELTRIPLSSGWTYAGCPDEHAPPTESGQSPTTMRYRSEFWAKQNINFRFTVRTNVRRQINLSVTALIDVIPSEHSGISNKPLA